MSTSPLRHPARAVGASLLRMQSDDRLVELARAGHEAAFDAIVVRYSAALTRYCGGIVGPSRADDAVQQTLINAHDALLKTDEVRHLRSWLYRIAHNVSLNVLRGIRDDVSLEDAGASARLTADGPAAEFERSEQFRATVAALQALPERQRAALVLRELEGRSHEEIADALGVTTGSARQHLMRARVAMRGAVTAITPWPLVARLAEMVSAGGGGAAGWSDAVAGGAGVGLGAGVMKVTAGLVATGALVGGAAVGTDRVVHHDGRGAEHVVRQAEAAARKAAPRVSAAAAATVTTQPVTQHETPNAATGTQHSPSPRSHPPRSDDGPSHRHGHRPAHAVPPSSSPGPGSGTATGRGHQEGSGDDTAGHDDGPTRAERKGKGGREDHGKPEKHGSGGARGKAKDNRKGKDDRKSEGDAESKVVGNDVVEDIGKDDAVAPPATSAPDLPAPTSSTDASGSGDSGGSDDSGSGHSGSGDDG